MLPLKNYRNYQGITTSEMTSAIILVVWVFYKARDEMRKAKPKLELRQRRLRELLAALEAHE